MPMTPPLCTVANSPVKSQTMYGDDIFKVKIISSNILQLKLLHVSPKQPTEMF